MYSAALAGSPSEDEAVAGAAATVLTYLFPDELARIDSLVAGAGGRSTPGFGLGQSIGRETVARAEGDGSHVTWVGTAPVGAGFWIPTPPAFVPTPLEPLAGTWRTWNIPTGSDFRPGPPPAFGSPQFLAELEEVYTVSRSLSPEQRRIAEYWADGAGTVTPPGHWNVIALELLRAASFGTSSSAEVLAALNTAQADAFIAAWDAKYAYWSLRPVSAIRLLIDPAWAAHIATPPFPSYVSGHSTTSGAASTVLGTYFPGRTDDLDAMAEKAAVSRLYGGIHFSSDNEAGLTLGRRVGAVAVAAYRSDRRGRNGAR